MKQVIFKGFDGYYITPKSNYYAYIQDSRKIHKLDGVNSYAEAFEMIEKFCNWYNDKPENYEIAKY